MCWTTRWSGEGKGMQIKEALLETVIGPTSALPQNSLPEIAFAGRSNVGKSSLINALMNRKRLAHTSASPGKTQTINYYRINNMCYFVDLPGYGYAKAPDSVKAAWGKMVENYLKKSRQLKFIFQLVDIRIEPTKDDRKMFSWIRERGFIPIVIATKSDKVKKNEGIKRVGEIRRILELKEDDVFFTFSALSKQGREEILDYLEKRVMPV